MSKKFCPGITRHRSLNMKTTEDLRAQLEAAAKASGRSLAAEVEYRVRLSFDREALLAQVREAVKPPTQPQYTFPNYDYSPFMNWTVT